MNSNNELAVSETQAKEWAEREALLKRIGVELSFVAQGGGQELDGILERLRSMLRQKNNTNGLRKLAEELFRYLVAHQDIRDPAAAQSFSDVCQALLAELKVPMRWFDDLEQLQKDAARATTLAQIETVIRKGAGLLRKANQQPARRPAASKASASWVARLRGAESRKSGVQQVIGALTPMLEQVLDQFAILGSDSEKPLELKSRLADVETVEESEQLLKEILDLLIDLGSEIHQRRQNTQNFLLALREKLHSIEEGVLGTLGRDSLAEAEVLQTRIGEQVTGIQDDVANTTDLNELKTLLDQRLDYISASVSVYLEEARKNHEEARRQAEELSIKVHDMEAESQLLRQEVEKKQLAAIKDPLTGVANRTGYEERVSEEFARHDRIGYPLCMIVVDIDRFKTINDSFGHRAGDMVLRKVVVVMRERLRDSDYIARYGGDEFIVLLPNTDIGGGLIVAESLRKGVESCGFHDSGTPVSVTISCGVVQVADNETPVETFKRADKAMYAAKKKQRNFCVAG